MKNILLIAAATAVAGGIIWLFTTEKGKGVRQIIADRSCELADAVKKPLTKETDDNRQPVTQTALG